MKFYNDHKEVEMEFDFRQLVEVEEQGLFCNSMLTYYRDNLCMTVRYDGRVEVDSHDYEMENTEWYKVIYSTGNGSNFNIFPTTQELQDMLINLYSSLVCRDIEDFSLEELENILKEQQNEM